MKTFPLCLAAALLATPAFATAGIPLFNYTCPGNLDVHADQGGPVYINGEQTTLKKFSDSYYEAKGANVTLSITTNPDESVSVSYTGPHGANGVCSERQPATAAEPMAANDAMSDFQFSCPTGLNVQGHAGKVTINGGTATVRKFSDDYLEARLGKDTISISRNPDQTVSASYTGAHGANGVCTGG